MPRAPKTPTAADAYWQKRLRSKAFKQALAGTLASEVSAMAGERVGSVLDPELVRTGIREWDLRPADRKRLADLLVAANRRVNSRLSTESRSLAELLDHQVMEDIETLVDGLTEQSAYTETFVADLMQQEFVRRLFTDIIYTAIVAFNKRVNPVFGVLTMRAFEDQIKGFIRLFMPMLLEQATAFATRPENQRLALDSVRQIVREVLEQPLQTFAAANTPAQRKQVEAAIRKATTNPKLDAAVRRAALTAFEDVYPGLREQRVTDVVPLDGRAEWIAERLADALLPVLSRSHIVQLIAAEAALATEPRPRASRAPKA